MSIYEKALVLVPLLAAPVCGPTEVLVGDAPGVARVVAGIPGVLHRFGFPDTVVTGRPARDNPIGSPAGLAALPDGSFYFADRIRRRIGYVTADGLLFWPVGRGLCGVPGPGSDEARDLCLADPRGLALEPSGTLIIADAGASVVYRYLPGSEAIERVFGTGSPGLAPDGASAPDAQTGVPADVAVGPDGGIYVAEVLNSRVVRIDPSGTVSAFAGSGVVGDSGDGGAAVAAQLARPDGLAWMGDTLYIADSGNNRIRRVVGETIEAYAGVGGAGFAGDGSRVGLALFRRPGRMVAVGSLLLIADRDNFRIRVIRVGPDSIATFGGTGRATVGLDLQDIGQTPIAGPAGITFAGRAIFVADSGGYVVRRIVR